MRHRLDRTAQGRRSESRRGVALLMTVVAIGVCIGILGLTFDLARIYIAKNELQTYADAASLAATVELDGTQEGIERARSVGTTFPNQWNFQTESVPSVSVQFSQYPDGPWFEFPPTPDGYRFAEAVAEADVRLYFMPVFEVLRPKATSTAAAAFGLPLDGVRRVRLGEDKAFAMLLLSNLSSAHVVGRGASGQLRKEAFGQGLIPYSPFAHLSPSHPQVTNPYTGGPDPFNFVVGQRYTMSYPPPGKSKSNSQGRCIGDRHMENAFPYKGADDRGFIDIGVVPGRTPGTNGSAFLRDAIVNNVQSHGVRIGDPIVQVSGQRQTEVDALIERIGQDSDSTSTSFSQYLSRGQGNGRRLVYMPVNDPYNGNIVVDFATFFLPPADEVCGSQGKSGGPTPCCAEYVGPGLLHSRSKGAATEVGVAEARLID